MIEFFMKILLVIGCTALAILLPVFIIFGSIREWIDDAWEDI